MATFLHIGRETPKRIKLPFKVNVTQELLKQLEELVGQTNVSLLAN
jgi:hypothetical protein